jgi:hypothetical protein
MLDGRATKKLRSTLHSQNLRVVVPIGFAQHIMIYTPSIPSDALTY